MKILEIEELRALSQRATPGEWFTGHLCNDDHGCNCPYIYSDCQNGMGAIATIGITDEEVATLDEAKANQALIAAAVNYVRNLIHPGYFQTEDKTRDHDGEWNGSDIGQSNE